MSRRHFNRDTMLESVRIRVRMQTKTTESEYQQLLARRDECTDANGFKRLIPRTLGEFRERGRVGPARGPGLEWTSARRNQ